MSILFAATYPARTIALLLYGTVADFSERDQDYKRDFAKYLDYLDREWGTLGHARKEIRDWGAPGHENDERLVAWLASYLRKAASPGAAVALERMNREINVSHALPAIHVPTLVIARTGDVDFPIAEVRDMTSRILGARLVEFPGDVHFPWIGDVDAIVDETERFIAEFRGQEAELERFLATVLFTDIVGSTERTARLGDHGWGELVRAHHSRVRGQLARFRGVEIDTAGDGFFATFDGPARGIRCATAITAAVRDLGIEVRAGLHTGEVERIGDKVGGIAVNIGARVAGFAEPSEVLVSQTVRDLVAGSGVAFEDRGEHELKGVPDRWRLYRVIG